MSKIMFVGDVHIKGIAPASRKETPEQYREVIIGKIKSVQSICREQGISNVIFLGDVYDNNTGINDELESEIWITLKEMRDDGIGVYSIIGNHDMYFNNEKDFKVTKLFKAFLGNIITHLDDIVIDNVYIKGIDFGKDFIPAIPNSKYSIMVGHCFYENEKFGGIGNENLTKDKCINLGYHAYVLGHDHTPYPTIKEKSYCVVRPGALTRGTSKTCNIYRKINVALFDTEKLEWSEVEIPSKPGTEVFLDKVLYNKSQANDDIDLNSLIDQLIVKKNPDFYDFLDENEETAKIKFKELYPDIKKILIEHCEALGIYRKVEQDVN